MTQIGYHAGEINKILGGHPRMLKHLFNFCKNLSNRIKQWTKPATATLVAASLTDMTRSQADLIAENAMLRQQLIVLNRQVKRSHLTNADCLRLVLLARCTRFWQQALHIVQPDTLLRWHRDLFRLYWRFKSRQKNREARITQEVIDLIKQMAQENRLWGAERMRGELLKLGIDASKRTIQKYLDKFRLSPAGSQTWGTFLKNHARHIWYLRALHRQSEMGMPGLCVFGLSCIPPTYQLFASELVLIWRISRRKSPAPRWMSKVASTAWPAGATGVAPACDITT
jgi:hypothetical protein